MNTEQLAAHVYRLLVKQGVPALSGGNCMYHSPQGLGCAIGILNPELSKDLEQGASFYVLLRKGKLSKLLEEFPALDHLVRWGFIEDSLGSRLQMIHDDAAMRNEFIPELKSEFKRLIRFNDWNDFTEEEQ